MQSIAQRFAALPAPSPADRLVLRAGTIADYTALAGFHYLRTQPVTATRVWVLEEGLEAWGSPCRVAKRFGDLRLEGWDWNLKSQASRLVESPERMATSLRSRTAAVLVESLPALACVLRDRATGGRYRGFGDRVAAAAALNAEVRCISRVVVHPRWRGLGLAVRLVRHALATATTVYTESLAAMGRVHPFFELAGMTAYRRPPLPRDRRLLDALRFAGVEAWELASGERIGLRLEACGLRKDGRAKFASLKPQDASLLLLRELRRWAGAGTLQEQLSRARRKLLCEPVYYLWRRLEA